AVGDDGVCGEATVYRALVHNHAKLAYHAVGAWLAGDGPLPSAVRGGPRVGGDLQVQDAVGPRLHGAPPEPGAPAVRTAAGRGGRLAAERPNRARNLIEDFMIAANGSIARFLEARRFPVLRRVVRSPERWQRIVALAGDLGERLPGEPDAPALNAFLLKRRAA